MSSSNTSNIIDLNTIQQQSRAKQRLEMIMHDSMSNIEEFGFQMYYASNMDSLDEYEIIPCYEYTQTDNIQISA